MAPLDMTPDTNTTTTAPANLAAQYDLIMTERAAEQVKKIAQSNQALRIGVYEGGCSGLKVGFDLTEVESDDVVFEAHGVKYVTDQWALDNLLNGASIDFIDEGVRARFVVTQPRTSSGCGCGSSFNKMN